MSSYISKIISDFNVKPLGNYLNNLNKKKSLIAETSQYGNIFDNLSKLEKKINTQDYYFGPHQKR